MASLNLSVLFHKMGTIPPLLAHSLRQASCPTSLRCPASGRGSIRADGRCHPQVQRGAGLAAAVALHWSLPTWQDTAASCPEVHKHQEEGAAGP